MSSLNCVEGLLFSVKQQDVEGWLEVVISRGHEVFVLWGLERDTRHYFWNRLQFLINKVIISIVFSLV